MQAQRHFEPWEPAEKRRLRREYTIHLLPIRKIADRHERTARSVQRMIEQMQIGRNLYGLKPPPLTHVGLARKRHRKPRMKLQRKLRSCLCCGNAFKSEHRFNRVCPRCQEDETFRFASAL